jgi:hypothetical protein
MKYYRLFPKRQEYLLTMYYTSCKDKFQFENAFNQLGETKAKNFVGQKINLRFILAVTRK